MGRGGSRGPLVAAALAAILIALSIGARHIWVLGYFPFSRHLPAPKGGEPRGTRPFQPVEDCPDCHQAAGDLHDRGPHRSILCEDCHGNAEEHVSGGEKVGDMPKSKSIAPLCSSCHREMNTLSESAPKLNLEAHVVETGALFSSRICLDCHRPHDPRP